MKTQTVYNMPIRRDGKLIGEFTGFIQWEKDMGSVTSAIGTASCQVSSESVSIPPVGEWKIDECANTNVAYCIFV